ncbi:MAG: hypothetical protein H8E89_11460 [Candidatus Nitrosopelagicus sp.]|nr:hypothetical protein [Candidatus Nitrosopelagicus sp.]MDC4231801.1 hypothetical protein [Nitrosopumilus sp.]
MSEISDLITVLQKSDLIAKCPRCSEESKLSEFLIWDGTGNHPEQANDAIDAHEKELEKAEQELEKKEIRSDTGAEQKAIDVGFGKTIEKLIHLHKEFKFPLADCRFLAEPIDVIIFNGSAQNSVDHITFMEIKSGKARLNTHQKMVKDAINDQNVKVEQIK